MEIDLSTPALLFSAISLLLLAYTNRFLALAQLVRNLYHENKQNPSQTLVGQIRNLKKRIRMIRTMQVAGLISLLLCVLSMFFIYIDQSLVAEILFGLALLCMILSLALSIWEIQISTHALELHLQDIEEKNNN